MAMTQPTRSLKTKPKTIAKGSLKTAFGDFFVYRIADWLWAIGFFRLPQFIDCYRKGSLKAELVWLKSIRLFSGCRNLY